MRAEDLDRKRGPRAGSEDLIQMRLMLKSRVIVALNASKVQPSQFLESFEVDGTCLAEQIEIFSLTFFGFDAPIY